MMLAMYRKDLITASCGLISEIPTIGAWRNLDGTALLRTALQQHVFSTCHPKTTVKSYGVRSQAKRHLGRSVHSSGFGPKRPPAWGGGSKTADRIDDRHPSSRSRRPFQNFSAALGLKIHWRWNAPPIRSGTRLSVFLAGRCRSAGERKRLSASLRR
jgi:hypothetical protein